MPKESAEELLAKILKALQQWTYIDYGPSLNRLISATILSGLATSEHVGRGIAEQAAKDLVQLGVQAGIVKKG